MLHLQAWAFISWSPAPASPRLWNDRNKNYPGQGLKGDLNCNCFTQLPSYTSRRSKKA